MLLAKNSGISRFMNFHKENRQAVEWFYLLNSATLKSHDVSYYFTKIKKLFRQILLCFPGERERERDRIPKHP